MRALENGKTLVLVSGFKENRDVGAFTLFQDKIDSILREVGVHDEKGRFSDS